MTATHPWDNLPTPVAATLDWHRAAAERDAAYLTLGPVDDTETADGPWTSAYAISLDDDPTLDGPEHFADAAQAFVGRHIGAVTAHHVAKTLSYLARAGLIVSPAEHQRVCDSYAARLAHVERAADELVARIQGGGDVA